MHSTFWSRLLLRLLQQPHASVAAEARAVCCALTQAPSITEVASAGHTPPYTAWNVAPVSWSRIILLQTNSPSYNYSPSPSWHPSCPTSIGRAISDVKATTQHLALSSLPFASLTSVDVIAQPGFLSTPGTLPRTGVGLFAHAGCRLQERLVSASHHDP